MILPALAALFALMAPGFAASSGDPFAARLDAQDIVYSPRAMSGARVGLIAEPSRHAAGVSVPAGVAALYGPQGKSDLVDHHQIGAEGEGEDKGLKKGWIDGDEGGGDDRGGSDREPRPQLDQELVKNNEFADGLAHWEHSGGAYTTDQFGPIRADPALSQDGIFAVAHNGYWGPRTQGHVQQAVQVPMARNAAFNMLYNFVTTEFPTWQGSEFNDNFKLTLTGPSGELTMSKAEFLNSGSFRTVTGVPLWGWDYTAEGQVIGGQTGWQVFSYRNLPLKSGIYTLRIEVNDVGDDIVDSAILVDRVSLR